MPTYIALLRGINVSGQKIIKMADLQRHFVAWGAANVRTYIQSGNVVFEHEDPPGKLRNSIEAHLAKKLGYAVPTLVKSAKELAAIARANPHDSTLPEFGRRMYVCIFATSPGLAAVGEIQSLVNENERLVVIGAAGYVYYAEGLGKAKLTSAIIGRKLGLATLRNWNTVTALLKLAETS